MATFDFNRLAVGVNADDIIARVLSYGPLKTFLVTNTETTSFTMDPPGRIKVKYEGTGFTYNSKDDPTKGIIESVVVTSTNHLEETFKITNLKVDIAALKASQGATLLSIFDGNDTFEGSRKADKLYGFKGKDTMNGSDGNDSLDGGAGKDTIHGDKGNDVLTGGGGADKFVFDTNIKTTAPNVDTITDFELTDRIVLDDRYFAGLALGDLATAAFVPGDATIASSSQARIVYDSLTGDLFYDGAGAARAPILFAHLDGAPALTAANFEIV